MLNSINFCRSLISFGHKEDRPSNSTFVSCERGTTLIEYVILILIAGSGAFIALTNTASESERTFNSLRFVFEDRDVEIATDSSIDGQVGKPFVDQFSMDFLSSARSGEKIVYEKNGTMVEFRLLDQLPGQKHYEAPGLVTTYYNGEIVDSVYFRDLKSASPTDVDVSLNEDGDLSLRGKFLGGNQEGVVNAKIKL